MASISLDPKSGHFHIRFRYQGSSFKRSLKTAVEKDAKAALARVEETLSLTARGVLGIPADADPAIFFLSGGKIEKRQLLEKGKPLTLGDLFQKYEETLPMLAKESSTLKTEATHLKRFRSTLPIQRAIDQLTTHDIQQFVNQESRRKLGSQYISPDTIKRHIDTLKCILNWGEKQELITKAPSLRGLVFGKRDEKPPFMTRVEIERIVARGESTEKEIEQLWDCLYLTIPEVNEVLELVRERNRYPFIYPMFAFVAFTGARRSEIIRVRVDDFDLQLGTVLIRERKRSRLRSTTFRRVEMPSNLVAIMEKWLANHPGGQYAFAQNFNKLNEAPTKALTVDQARSQFEKVIKNSRWDVIRGFHVFRHSYASNLAANGVDQRIIDLHMGHQTEEMRKRYQHLIPAVCKKAMEVLSV